MAVMQPKENVCVSTQIENITEFVFVCLCVLNICMHRFDVIQFAFMFCFVFFLSYLQRFNP